MWKKIVDLSTDIRVKIAAAILSLVPPLGLVLKYFYVLDEDNNIVSFSALEFREIYIEHNGDNVMFAAAAIQPLFTTIFVVSVIAGLTAIGISFIRKKAATIMVYVLTLISGYTPTLAFSFMLSLFEESSVANLPVILILIMWGSCVFPISMAGIALAALSKNYN